MASQTYSLSELPAGASWVYRLNSTDAITQCEIFGLSPAATLSDNRKMLSEYLSARAIHDGTETSPSQHTEFKSLLADSQQPTVAATESSISPTVTTASSANAAATAPPAATTCTATPSAALVQPTTSNAPTDILQQQPPLSFGDVRLGPVFPASVMSNRNPLLLQPSWTDIVQATAVAVGTQVAAAMAESRSPAGVGGARMSVLPDLIRGLPIASGTDPRKLVIFLVAATKIANLSLFSDEDLALAILPRTTDHLRDFWLQGISSRTKMAQLVENVRDFFIPAQLRHSLITSMVYRIQEPSESLPDFIDCISTTSKLLIPTFKDSDVLDTVMNGLNASTRAALSGLPVPSTLSDLLALAPRLQIIRSLQSSTTSEHVTQKPFGSQHRPQQQHRQSYNSSRPSFNQQFNSRHSNNHNNRQYSQFQNFAPQIPESPFRNSNNSHQSNLRPGQGNYQGGRR